MDKETILRIAALLCALFMFREVFSAVKSRETTFGSRGIDLKRRENPIGFYFAVLFEIFMGAACLIIAFGLFFEDGKKDGPYETYYENGQLKSKGSHKDGEQDGLWEWYNENGQIELKGSFKDGKREGPWEFYHGNGSISIKGSYKDGERDGLFEFYDKEGKLSLKKTYKDGELISEEKF
ncbi:MAG: toxin-antitoxin system YwqK family antitoxin [Opitutales bacterium]|nr:toxin-antitoxin system YwqK family antitoxin [Opitutales bacterium]